MEHFLMTSLSQFCPRLRFRMGKSYPQFVILIKFHAQLILILCTHCVKIVKKCLISILTAKIVSAQSISKNCDIL